MAELVIYIFLFSVYSVILFYGNSTGLNIFLYNIPLLVFMVFILIRKNKVKNKYGLLFIVPIIILSLCCVLYNNIFTKFNIIFIPILFLFTYIYTIRPTFNITEIICDLVLLIFKRFDLTFIRNFINIFTIKINKIIKIKKDSWKKIMSFLLVIPIIIFILILLITADTQFKNLFNFLFDSFDKFNYMDIFIKIILIVIEFILMGSFINYLLFHFENENKPKTNTFKIENFTIKVLLLSLDFIYIIFDFIQIRSLFFHHVGDGIVYSEYARTGFFQLMFVSIINIIILLLTKKSKENNLIKHLSLLMVILTFIIICSSFYRMYLYDVAYGYTILRLLVYITLITESIMLIPTIFYIYNSKVNIFKNYMIISIFIYTIINIYSIDKVIAKNNIYRYDKTNKIDIVYLVSLSYDDVLELYNFYSNVKDEEIKNNIKDLVCDKYVFNNDSIYGFYIKKDDNFFEYNYNRNLAFKTIDKFNCSDNEKR